MNPSQPFIVRPVATSLLMIAIMLVGIVGFGFLPLSALPEVDYPTIQIQTFLPGASPDVMATSVTAPLERQLGEMPGLKEMTSISSGGASVVTLQFDLTISPDIAEQEVQASINAAQSLLPQTLPAPPVYAKVNPADAPVLTLAVSGNTLPLIQIEDLAETRIAQKISQLEGVGLVSINGGQRPAASRPISRRSPPMASTSTISERRFPTPIQMRRKAASTAPRATTRSTPTTRYKAPTTTRGSSLPTKMETPYFYRMWRTSSRARRTPRFRAG
jgi:hypothetical protein